MEQSGAFFVQNIEASFSHAGMIKRSSNGRLTLEWSQKLQTIGISMPSLFSGKFTTRVFSFEFPNIKKRRGIWKFGEQMAMETLLVGNDLLRKVKQRLNLLY